MNSHTNKMNSKTFRNVFFNCHHFIRFRFISFRISMVLDYRMSVSLYELTLHETWDKQNKPRKKNKLRKRKQSAIVSLTVISMIKWQPLYAKENRFTLLVWLLLQMVICKTKSTFGLSKLSLKKNRFGWNISNMNFKSKRFFKCSLTKNSQE